MPNLNLIPLPTLPLVITRADDRWKRPAHGRCNEAHRTSPQSVLQWLCRGLIASVIVLGLQSPGHAHGNLVNLYDWNNASTDLPPDSQNVVIQITSANSGYFRGAIGANGYPIQDILTGNFATVPGTLYEITYSLSHNPQFTFSAEVLFGDSSMNAAAVVQANTYLTNFGYAGGVATFDYTAVAPTDTTTMSFLFSLDNSDSMSLSDLSVIAVPEPSATGILGSVAAGCLLLAQRCRRSHQKRNTIESSKTDR